LSSAAKSNRTNRGSSEIQAKFVLVSSVRANAKQYEPVITETRRTACRLTLSEKLTTVLIPAA
jgi:hypothetical protein